MTRRRQRIPATPPGLDDETLVGNAADKKQLRKAKKVEKYTAEQRDEDVRYLQQFPEFRRFLWHEMGECRTFESTFHPDPYVHAFNAGQRDAGNRLLSRVMSADAEAFLRMIEENRKEREIK